MLMYIWFLSAGHLLMHFNSMQRTAGFLTWLTNEGIISIVT
jgi:hypothetical protein